MTMDTPARWSCGVLRRVAAFRHSQATRDAVAWAAHLEVACVRPLDLQRNWDAGDPTPLAASPEALSTALLHSIFSRDLQVDLVQACRDAIPGLEVTELHIALADSRARGFASKAPAAVTACLPAASSAP